MDDLSIWAEIEAETEQEEREEVERWAEVIADEEREEAEEMEIWFEIMMEDEEQRRLHPERSRQLCLPEALLRPDPATDAASPEEDAAQPA